MVTMASVTPAESLIRWNYALYALAALGVMIAAIEIGNLWFLNFVHVSTSLLFVIGFAAVPELSGDSD